MFKKRYIPLKSIFRWWWTIQDTFDPESCNCLITQLKHQETLDLQPSLSALPLQYSEPPLTASSEIDPLLLRIFNPHDLNNLATVFRNNQNRLVEECTLKGYKRELRRQPNQNMIHNHIDKNYHISNKKALFYNVKNYCEQLRIDPFCFIPITFHIQDGLQDQEYQQFVQFFKNKEAGNIINKS